MVRRCTCINTEYNVARSVLFSVTVDSISTYAGDRYARNLYKKLVQVSCMSVTVCGRDDQISVLTCSDTWTRRQDVTQIRILHWLPLTYYFYFSFTFWRVTYFGYPTSVYQISAKSDTPRLSYRQITLFMVTAPTSWVSVEMYKAIAKLRPFHVFNMPLFYRSRTLSNKESTV